MKKLLIQEKLEQIGVEPSSVILGDFDYIGRFTAERQRSQDDVNYKKFGAFFRSNYERGILIYYLIRKFNVQSVLEIGFGRGYSTFCAARAFHDSGYQGKITTVDPALKRENIEPLTQVFPREWFAMINFVSGYSADVLKQMNGQKFDLIYIDGDHSYEGTKSDWQLCSDKFNKFLLFDDYHLPSKDDPGIKCREAIDEIDEAAFDCAEKELLILDRRMFVDDRGYTNDQINYGQVLLTKKSVDVSDW